MSPPPVTLSLLDDIPKPCLLVDPAEVAILWSNTATQEYFGISRNRALRTPLSDLLNIDGIIDLINRVAAEAAPIVLRDIPLGRSQVEVTLFPSSNQVGILITPDRATTSRPVQGRSVKSLGQMIGHELKNPLAGIKGAAQLLRHDLDNAESLGLLDIISSEIDRIRRLADRLQTFGDSDTGETARANIHTLLRNARKVMSPSAPQVFFTEDYDPSLPHLDGDSDQLMQVLVNLIKNAIEAMDGEGEIILRTRSRSGARRGEVGLPIEVQIIDNGPGLPSHMTDRVFEPFVTSKPSGQGLGLALVAKVIASHGGVVETDSQPGRTRFSILLPAAKDT